MAGGMEKSRDEVVQSWNRAASAVGSKETTGTGAEGGRQTAKWADEAPVVTCPIASRVQASLSRGSLTPLETEVPNNVAKSSRWLKTTLF